MAGGEMMTEVALYPEFSPPGGETGEQEVKVPVERYSRIVGYIRPLQSWSAQKQLEFSDRVTFDVSKIAIAEEAVP
jgi:hypothetical protein